MHFSLILIQSFVRTPPVHVARHFRQGWDYKGYIYTVQADCPWRPEMVVLGIERFPQRPEKWGREKNGRQKFLFFSWIIPSPVSLTVKWHWILQELVNGKSSGSSGTCGSWNACVFDLPPLFLFSSTINTQVNHACTLYSHSTASIH